MDKIQIFLRYQNNIRGYACKRDELLSSVCEKFKKDSGILNYKLEFLLHGRMLDEKKTLKEMNILDTSFIDVGITNEVIGGGLGLNFTDVSKNIYIEQEFSKKVPDYKIASKGINLIGICKGPKCKAYNKVVICPLEKKKNFDLIEEKDYMVCPKCKCLIIPKTIGFYSCEYKIKGKKYENDNIKSFELEDKASDKNSIKYFDPEKSGNAIFIQLIIEVIKFL
jgi:hypothetical protein